VSGIAAVWRPDGAPLPPADLDRVLERLTPRPDDPADRWLDGPVGLGQRMLAGARDALHATLSRGGEAQAHRAYRARQTMPEVRQVWRLALLALRLRCVGS